MYLDVSNMTRRANISNISPRIYPKSAAKNHKTPGRYARSITVFCTLWIAIDKLCIVLHFVVLCTINDDPNREDTNFGLADTTGDEVLQGTTGTFKCKVGYQPLAATSSTCGVSGQWTPALPSCVPATCPKPDDAIFLENVDESQSNYTSLGSESPIGTKFVHQCKSGFELAYADPRNEYVCQSDKTWSPTIGTVGCYPEPGKDIRLDRVRGRSTIA